MLDVNNIKSTSKEAYNFKKNFVTFEIIFTPTKLLDYERTNKKSITV